VWTSTQPFSPLDLSPVVWLDAADATTIIASSGSVSQWNDKSGNSRHVAQSASGSQPTTGIRTINSLNALDFTPNQFLRNASTQLVDATTGHFTLFVLFVSDALSGTRQLASQDDLLTPRMPQMGRTNGTAYETVRIAGGVFTDASGVTLSTGVTYVAASQHRTGNIEAYINGSTNGSTSTTGTNGTRSAPFAVGAQSTVAPSSNHLDGAVGEVVIYSKNLTNGEMNLVGDYLAAKWGGTWAAL
jgi:hypothetical protein